ncbi:MAG TPA: ABC transporter ATP-binding protein [Chloroflexota bacterium]
MSLSRLQTPDASPEPALTPAYDLRDVTKRFGGGRTAVIAVRSIDLHVDAGEFVVIAGPSGSGKTTLLQLLGALDRPTSGQVVCQGRDISTMSDRELSTLRLQTIGFIFQQFNLIPTLTARHNVEVALAPFHVKGAERTRRAQELLSAVGLAHRADHLPSQLSGGEQQRVAIARALANRPSILLADEPTGNLDSTTGEEILKLLNTLSAEQSHTVIVITHDLAIATSAKRVIRLRDGTIAGDTGESGGLQEE